MNTIKRSKVHVPGVTYASPHDGNTYYFAPLPSGEVVLWACPTASDGSADFVSAIPESEFAEPLSPTKREQIVAELTR